MLRVHRCVGLIGRKRLRGGRGILAREAVHLLSGRDDGTVLFRSGDDKMMRWL